MVCFVTMTYFYVLCWRELVQRFTWVPCLLLPDVNISNNLICLCFNKMKCYVYFCFILVRLYRVFPLARRIQNMYNQAKCILNFKSLPVWGICINFCWLLAYAVCTSYLKMKAMEDHPKILMPLRPSSSHKRFKVSRNIFCLIVPILNLSDQGTLYILTQYVVCIIVLFEDDIFSNVYFNTN